MTEYILDTDTCIYLLKGNEEIRRRSGQTIQDFDILIASITLVHGGVLVTNNVKHFKRIPELTYESWLQE